MPDRAIEQIKEKLDLVEFLRGYLELRPAGVNFKAHCPFHKEKTPSFMVSSDKQIWRCFGCNEGGDIFKFLMKYENIEFYEALKLLAEKANVPLARISPFEQKEFGVLYDIHRAAVDYYENCLRKSSVPQEYLSSRNLSENSIQKFEIGFAPNDYEGLAIYLINKGFEITDSLRAGLVIKTERGNYIDRFRGRIMFPLESNSGKVVGFTGRVLPQFDTGEVGKYINSPETSIFSKSKLLYGLSKSKDGIREAGSALLVEGQMDVIMSHQDGVKNAIGTSGTALTDQQLSILRRYSSKLVLNFDNDEAGKQAMERSIELAYAKDFEIEILDFASIPEAGGFKDSANIVSEKPGILRNLISRAIPAMEYYFIRYPVIGTNIAAKKQNVREILRKIMNISSAVERSHWQKELAFRSGVREADLLLEAKSFTNLTFSPASERHITGARAGIPLRASRSRYGGIAEEEKPDRKTKIAARLVSLYFTCDTAKSELERVKSYLPQSELELYNAIVSNPSNLDEVMRQKIADLSLKSGLEDENTEQEASELASNLELEALIEERDTLSAEIKSNRLGEEEKEKKSLFLIEIAKKIEKIKIKK